MKSLSLSFAIVTFAAAVAQGVPCDLDGQWYDSASSGNGEVFRGH